MCHSSRENSGREEFTVVWMALTILSSSFHKIGIEMLFHVQVLIVAVTKVFTEFCNLTVSSFSVAPIRQYSA